jgi:hypothetical protein
MQKICKNCKHWGCPHLFNNTSICKLGISNLILGDYTQNTDSCEKFETKRRKVKNIWEF